MKAIIQNAKSLLIVWLFKKNKRWTTLASQRHLRVPFKRKEEKRGCVEKVEALGNTLKKTNQKNNYLSCSASEEENAASKNLLPILEKTLLTTNRPAGW